MGVLGKMPSVSSIKKSVETKINGVVDNVMKNPDMDEDALQKSIEESLGIDETKKEYLNKGKKVLGIVGTVKSAVTNPKGFAVNLVKDKAAEYLKERPEVQQLKEQVMDYAKSKVEVMPQYKAVKSEVEKATNKAKSDPEKLMKEMEDPVGFATERYHKIFG